MARIGNDRRRSKAPLGRRNDSADAKHIAFVHELVIGLRSSDRENALLHAQLHAEGRLGKPHTHDSALDKSMGQRGYHSHDGLALHFHDLDEMGNPKYSDHPHSLAVLNRGFRESKEPRAAKFYRPQGEWRPCANCDHLPKEHEGGDHCLACVRESGRIKESRCAGYRAGHHGHYHDEPGEHGSIDPAAPHTHSLTGHSVPERLPSDIRDMKIDKSQHSDPLCANCRHKQSGHREAACNRWHATKDGVVQCRCPGFKEGTRKVPIGRIGSLDPVAPGHTWEDGSHRPHLDYYGTCKKCTDHYDALRIESEHGGRGSYDQLPKDVRKSQATLRMNIPHWRRTAGNHKPDRSSL